MSKQSEPTTPTAPTTPTGRVGKTKLKRSQSDIGLTPTTSEKQRYGRESASPHAHGKRRGRPLGARNAPNVKEFFNTSPVPTTSSSLTTPNPSSTSLKTSTMPLDVSSSNLSDPHLNSVSAHSTPALASTGVTSPTRIPRPIVYQSSPPVFNCQRRDTPNPEQEAPSSPVLPPVRGNLSPLFSPITTFRRHPGPPRSPSPTSRLCNPLQQREWLYRSVVEKGIVSSPDKLAVPLSTLVDEIPTLQSDDYTLEQRIKFVNRSLKNAGFDRAEDYLFTLMTTKFDSLKKNAPDKSNTCHILHLLSWSSGFPKLLHDLDNFVSTRVHHWAWTEKLKPYKEKVVESASTVLEWEFKRFAVREDSRSIDPNTGKRERQDVNPDALIPSYLQLKALEVTPELLASNLMSETQAKFETEASIDSENIEVETIKLILNRPRCFGRCLET